VVTLTHTNALIWAAVAASEDHTNISFWSASSGGDFGGSGVITAEMVAVSDDFELSAESLVITQPCAA
jgi:hypothetical protein